MKIDVIEVKDREDGSADLLIDMSEDAQEFFMKKGIVDTLRESIVEIKKEQENESKVTTMLPSSMVIYKTERVIGGTSRIIGPGVNITTEVGEANMYASFLNAAYIMGWNDRGTK